MSYAIKEFNGKNYICLTDYNTESKIALGLKDDIAGGVFNCDHLSMDELKQKLSELEFNESTSTESGEPLCILNYMADCGYLDDEEDDDDDED